MLRNGKTKTFWNIFFNIFYFTSYLLVFLIVPLSLQKIKKFSKKLSNFPFVSRDETGVSSLETKVSPLETFKYNQASDFSSPQYVSFPRRTWQTFHVESDRLHGPAHLSFSAIGY